MLKKITLTMGASFLLIGCISGTSTIREIDPKDIVHLEDRYDSHDLEQQAANMVQSLLREKIITDNPTPKIMLGKIVVDDSIDNHVDVHLIQQTIQHHLIKSKRADFIDNANIKVLEHQIDYQNSSKYIDKNTANVKGKFVAPKYMLNGRISKIMVSNGSMKDVTYKLLLQLTNIETSMIVWKQIDTVAKRVK